MARIRMSSDFITPFFDNLIPMGYEAKTVDSTSGGVSLTSTEYLGTSGSETTSGDAGSAFLTLESGQIRFTLEGTAPTTTVGHLLEIGQTLTLANLDQIKNFKAIRTGDTSGSLKVTYFK